MAGFLGCLVNSTIGTTSLFTFNFIEGAAVKRTWLTWWLGDSVGVISFAALIIAFYRVDKYIENFKKIY
jgi:integral membrane sensor domain MASE1